MAKITIEISEEDLCKLKAYAKTVRHERISVNKWSDEKFSTKLETVEETISYMIWNGLDCTSFDEEDNYYQKQIQKEEGIAARKRLRASEASTAKAYHKIHGK